jgi:NAD(P)-dependent dehydrogenase (short-subunit alcohol dehydrogenase family)
VRQLDNYSHPATRIKHHTPNKSNSGLPIGGIMSTAATGSLIQREPALLGQTVVVIGGSAGIGLETARQARAEGAKLILTGRNPERLDRAQKKIGAFSSAAFDAEDPASLERFFAGVPATIDHVMVTAGQPHYGRIVDMDFEQLRHALDAHLLVMVQVARCAAHKVRPGGTLLFMGGTGGRRPAIGTGIASTVTAALPAVTANLALELAPVRVNLIAAGFVDTPLSASLLGDELEKRRNQLRATLPIGRVVEPADVAALAVHIMINTALTGATYDIDGGQQLVAG